MSVAAILQRRWMATKLVAAALSRVVCHFDRRSCRRAIAAVVIALALALAAIGLDGFAPWMFGVDLPGPAALLEPAAAFLWLEVYGSAIVVVVLLSLRVRRALGHASADRGVAARAAAMVLFLATVALMMNGFLSILARRAVGGPGCDVRVGRAPCSHGGRAGGGDIPTARRQPVRLNIGRFAILRRACRNVPRPWVHTAEWTQ